MGIILASSSPRRKKILENLGYNFIIKIPDLDEDNINNLNPIDYVIDVSMRKGLKIHEQYKNDFVVSGDTIVEFKDKIIGRTTSANYSFNFKKNLAFGYIKNIYRTEDLLANDIYIEVEKQKYQAQLLQKPLKQSNFKNI